MKVSVFIGTSVDGFIARHDDGLDWLPVNGGEPHGYVEFIASVDAIVIGRKTFDKVMTFDSWPYGNKQVVVLTTRPAEVVPPTGAVCDVMAGTPQAVVTRLTERGMTHLYIDGGVTIQRFLEAGLIQRMFITRVPVLIGAGIPLFGPLTRDVRLEHVATRSYPSGLVQSEYLIPAS